ncbi:MAG: UDP-glucose 4-epimerase GalE [Cyclobacteriaceae bacterium]
MSKKVLLTGGTGFIGSHTAVELINEGFEVVIIDDLSNSNIEVLDRIEQIVGVKPLFEQVDVRNLESLQAVFAKYEFSSIIHFAAKKAVGESVEKPVLYYDVNVNGMLNLLKVMKEFQVPNVVFSSSCTVYGQPDKLPVTESTPFQPAESPYGNSKQIGEEILQDTTKADPNLHAISLRYFNPVGAHESALIGELPVGVPANLIPFITQTAAGIRAQLKVFGGDYNTPDGSAVRDYIHVVDLAKAHVIALKRMENAAQKSNYEFFNIGTGTGSSVLQAINAFEESAGVKVNYLVVDRRAGDIEQIYADTTFANDELGWKAEKGLKEMMSSAWKWQQTLH